jgi:hypothetical protein
MFYFLISTIVLVGFLDNAARRSRFNILQTRTRFELFRLRDELRMAAIDGQIEQSNWFDYFDTTFTKMIDLLPSLTVWQIAFLMLHYRKDPEMMRKSEALMQFLNEDSNHFYRDLFERYAASVGRFLLDRHSVVKIAYKVLERWATDPGKLREETSEIVATAPETSTFSNYCMSS